MPARRRTKAASPRAWTPRPRAPGPHLDFPTLFPGFRAGAFLEDAGHARTQALADLRDAYRHRGLVLYVGAGVSRSLGLPSWPELMRSLGVTLMGHKVRSAAQALGEAPTDEAWEHLLALAEAAAEDGFNDRPLLMMARAVKSTLRQQVPGAVARALYRPVLGRLRRAWPATSRAGVRPWRLPTSPLVEALVALARAERDVRGLQAIVNYNFDDLLDEKLREQHVRCVTVVSGSDRTPTGALPCYHVHGLLPARRYVQSGARGLQALGSFVFSEDEYHAEYAAPYTWSNMTQISYLGRHTGLLVGLSLEDPNLRRLLDVTHRQYPDVVRYALLRRRRPLATAADSAQTVLGNLYERVETESLESIGVRPVWVDDFAELPALIAAIVGEG